MAYSIKNKRCPRKVRSDKRKSKRVYGGDCGCSKSLWNGGSSGPSNLGDLPIRHFYGLNNHQNDPEHMQTSVRMEGMPLSKGGAKKRGLTKRKNCKSKRRYKKKISGGDGSLSNFMSNFGDSTGLNNMSSNLFGNATTSLVPNELLNVKPYSQANPYLV